MLIASLYVPSVAFETTTSCFSERATSALVSATPSWDTSPSLELKVIV
jgi:hypothetical protein